MRLRDAVSRLLRVYGPDAPPSRDWFALVVLENVAYLVDDARRLSVFRALERSIGLTPSALLAADLGTLASVIADGGMKPLMRAEKVRRCAEIAVEIGEQPITRKLLQKFPGIGEPSADKILLFCLGVPSVAPDSNALRVLTRLGFVEEQRNHAATYRAAIEATRGELRGASDAVAAHLALRRHGQEVCKRTAPRCEVCVLREECAWYRRHA
ncbi:MAG TPA: hypothetical protein VJ276_04800 [Thermoanaerobaculia bacterium]|nr:hypothetical protein [Thermoanaerobaculia bacterium]